LVFTQARKHYMLSLSTAVAIWKDGWVSIEITSLSEITWSTSRVCTNLYRVGVQRQLRGRILPTGETGSGPTWTGGSGRRRDLSGAGQPVEVIGIKLCFFVTDAEARKARVFVPVMIVQGILKVEVSLYRWPPVLLVWISLFFKKIVISLTADSKPVKQEVNGTVILPPLVFPRLSNQGTLTEGEDLLVETRCFVVTKI
jgi:hypothetical protein